MRSDRLQPRFPLRQLLLALVALAALGWVAPSAGAEDPPPPPILHGTVKPDSSTPPEGWYPNPDRPDYDAFPTVYNPPVGTPADLDRPPLGNELKAGSSFQGEAQKSDQPTRFIISSRTPGKRLLFGAPGGVHFMEPYFRAEKASTCQVGDCSPPLDVTLYARWGSVEGMVTLEDGTPLPPDIQLSVYAKPEDPVPPGGEEFLAPRSVFVDKDGFFYFNQNILVQDDPKVFQCEPPFNYVCLPVEFELSNNWGLGVLGDGGLSGYSPLTYSNKEGEFKWKIYLSSKHEEVVTVKSSDLSFAFFLLSLKEARAAEEEQEENRDKCSSSPKPVSLITGNVFLDQTDTVLPGLTDPIVFERSYNSRGNYSGAMGFGWNHSFEKRLEALSPFIVRLWDANGAPRYFTDPDQDGVLAPYGRREVLSTIRKLPSGGFERRFREGGYEEYQADGRLLKQVDRLGRATSLVYSSGIEIGVGRLTEIVSPEGRRLTLEYEQGLLKRLVGPEGIIAEYSYRTFTFRPQLLEVRYANGTGYRFSYNSSQQLLTVSDLAGVVLDRHGYDGSKAAWSELNGGRERRNYTYEANRTVVTDANGAVSTFEFEDKKAGRFVSKITGCGFCGSQLGTQVFEHDDEGRVTRYLDADGNETVNTWSGDDLQTVTNALGQTTEYADRDEFGRPQRITRAGWGTTTLTYSLEGVKTVTLPTGQTSTVTYENQRPTKVQTAGGTTYELDINDLGELRSVTDGRGKKTRYAYDAFSRVKSVTLPDGRTTTMVRGPLGQIRAIKRPDGKEMGFAYDASGRVSSQTDEAGRSLRYTYDAYDRPEALVDALGGVTQVSYDLMSNVTSLTDAKRQTTSFDYDEVGRVRETRAPLSGAASYEYYPSGRLRTRTDRKGVRTTYTYDGIGRLRTKTYSDGTPAFSIVYDDDARRMTLSNGSDTVTRTFDGSGRLLSEASTAGGSTVSYTYTDDHARETLSLDGEEIARYTYEGGYPKAFQFDGKQISFGYDDAGRRTELVYPNGLKTTYAYEPMTGWLKSLLTSQGTTPLWEIAYTHDEVGNRLSKATPETTETYSYDALHRLTGVSRPAGPNADYAFDAVGNRSEEREGGRLRRYSYDARNRLSSVVTGAEVRVSGTTSEPATVAVHGQPARLLPGNTFEADVPTPAGEATVTVKATDASGNTRTNTYRVETGAGSATYGYDENGNLTSKTDGSATSSYEWDAENQLKRILTDGQEIARFAYDPLGRRIEKVAGGVTTGYVYDGLDVLRETKNDGTRYVYLHGPGIDEPLARVDQDDNWTYVHADGLGSIVKVTDQTGTVVQTRQYDAWGNLEAGADQAGYAFTGREWDPETGLYYYRARYYDPRIARFVSEDPVRLVDGLNLYSYVKNRPLIRKDPSGLIGIGLTGGASGALGGLLIGFGINLSGGVGGFYGDGVGSLGAFLSGGGFLGGLDGEGGNFGLHPSGKNPYGNMTAGYYGGAGAGCFFTNAKRAEQLSGPFDTLIIDTPFGSFQVGASGDTWIASATAGPGLFGAVSSYSTVTAATTLWSSK